MAVLWSLTPAVAVVLILLSTFADQVLAATTDVQTCSSVAAELNSLTACSTASQFCSSYLHKKVTAISTVKTTTTIIVSTTTITSGTGTSTATATSTTYYVTSQVTTTALTCPSSQRLQRRGTRTTSKQTSCGFATSATPSAVTVACDCFLKPVTTITKTVTKTSAGKGAGTTVLETKIVPATYTTTTTTTTLTLGTSTSYGCVTPATPLCYPFPLSNFVVNPSFEDPQLAPGATSKSTNAWVVNLPEPYENDFVTFISNPSFAPDGSIYMSMYSSYSYSIEAQQVLHGLPTDQYLTVSFAYNIPVAPNGGFCELSIVFGLNTIFGILYFENPTSGWTTAVATGKAPASDSDFIFVWYCPAGAYGNVYDTIDIDSVLVGVPETHCAMYLAFYFPAIDYVYGYVALSSPDTTSSPTLTLVTDQSLASTFSLDSEKRLFAISNGYPQGYWEQTISEATNGGPIYASNLASSVLNCALDPVTLYLSCSSYGGTNSVLNLVTDGAGNQVLNLSPGGQAVTLMAIYPS